MVLLFITSIVVVALILFFGKRLKPKIRVALVVLALVLVNLPTILFIVVGDKAPPGARTVTQEELQKAAEP